MAEFDQVTFVFFVHFHNSFEIHLFSIDEELAVDELIPYVF
jgi:hypothetical protein